MVVSVNDKRPVPIRSGASPMPAAAPILACPIADSVPCDSYGSAEIGFDLPERYNASVVGLTISSRFPGNGFIRSKSSPV
jgi:hypothetical protein